MCIARRISSKQLTYLRLLVTLADMRNVIVTGLSGDQVPNDLNIVFIGRNRVPSEVASLKVNENPLSDPYDRFTEISLYETIQDVAYSKELDKLYVTSVSRSLENPPKFEFIVYHMRRERDSSWNEVRHDNYRLPKQGNGRMFVRVASERYLVFGEAGVKTLYVCRLLENGLLPNNYNVYTLPANNSGFDIQVVGEYLLLAVAYENGSITLYRQQVGIETLEGWQTSSARLVGARLPLFAGDTLLVIGDHQNVMAFGIAGGTLNHDGQVPINGQRPTDITTWCFLKYSSERHLVVWNNITKELLLYQYK